MTTVLLYLFAAIVAVAAVKAIYWLAITRLLSGEPLADEVHTVTTKDGWKIKLFRYRRREGAGGEGRDPRLPRERLDDLLGHPHVTKRHEWRAVQIVSEDEPVEEAAHFTEVAVTRSRGVARIAC